jgi:DivIVA domain-containing protein
MDLTPQVLKDVEFREKFRGYDPDEVDAFLEQVGTAIGQLQSRLRSALDQAGSQRPSEPGRLHDPDGSLQRVLLAAQETADKVVYDAEAEASTMLREAEQKSSSMISEADEHSEKVRAAAASEARRALEEAREPLLAEIADLRSDRERLHGEVVAVERFLDDGRADVLASLERLQATLSDPAELVLGDSPVPDPDPDDGRGGGSPTGSEPVVAVTDIESETEAPAPAAEPMPAPPMPSDAMSAPAAVAAPDEPPSPPQASATPDVVVDLTAEPQPAMASVPKEAAVWAEGGEVIHGAFAAAEPEASLDLVDPDGGPPTEAYMNLLDEGGGESGDRFLDELRRAVDDEDDALGRPDEEADAAMTAFFDQDEDEPNPGRS